METNRTKALPFEVSRGFSAVPNAILSHYFYHPKFNGNVFAVYAYLLAHYNDNEGYAFPTIEQASNALVMSDRTFRNAVKTLEDVELIETRRHKRFGNNVYYFRNPIEDKSEFFARFPEASEKERAQAEIEAKIKPRRDEAKWKYDEDRRDEESVDSILSWL